MALVIDAVALDAHEMLHLLGMTITTGVLVMGALRHCSRNAYTGALIITYLHSHTYLLTQLQPHMIPISTSCVHHGYHAFLCAGIYFLRDHSQLPTTIPRTYLTYAWDGVLSYALIRALLLMAGDVEPHPGPSATTPAPPHPRIRIGALNAPGQHVIRNRTRGPCHDDGYGDGFDLRTTPNDTMRLTRQLATEQQFDILVLAETRTREAEIEALRGHWSYPQNGIQWQSIVTAGKASEKNSTQWGVTVVWRADKFIVKDAHIVIPARVVCVTLEVIGDIKQEPITIYGCYMPSRQAAHDVVDAAWDVLTPLVIANRRAWVVGDLNAEPTRVVTARGRALTYADQRLDTLIEAAHLRHDSHGRQTHAKGGELDHILASQMHADTVSRTNIHIWQGQDHDCVYTDYRYHEDTEGWGDIRPIGPKLNNIPDAEWAKFSAAAIARYDKELPSITQNDGIAHAHLIQSVTTHCARDMLKRMADARSAAAADATRAASSHLADADTPSAPPPDASVSTAQIHPTPPDTPAPAPDDKFDYDAEMEEQLRAELEHGAFADEDLEDALWGRPDDAVPPAPQSPPAQPATTARAQPTLDASNPPESDTSNDDDSDDDPDFAPPDTHTPRRRRRNATPRRSAAERMRCRASTWAWLAWRAHRYWGSVQCNTKRFGLARKKPLRHILMDASLTKSQRRQMIIEICTRKAAKYKTRLEQLTRMRSDALVARMAHVAARQKGGGSTEMWRVIREALGGGRTVDARLAEINDDDGNVIRDPASVRQVAHTKGTRIHAVGSACIAGVQRMLRDLWPARTPPPTGLDDALTWENFQHALQKSEASKGVGIDEWNSYLLRKTPVRMQRAYWHALCQMVRTSRYPAAYHEWIAMLAVKSRDEDPRQLERRRDLWLTCHGQKLIMRMLNHEYERVADSAVPGSQAGYARNRNAPEQTLVLRIAQEHAMMMGTDLYIGYLDLGSFFMSCVREVQWEVERWTGVDPGVTAVVHALHDDAKGQYETAWGLTDFFPIRRGNGQGCVNGAVRSKLLLTVMQRMVNKYHRGLTFTDGVDIPALYFADDACFLSSNLAGLQLAYDCAWMVTRICGLEIGIKGKKKTAYMAIYYSGTRAHDVTGWDVQDGIEWGGVRLPDKRAIPQIKQGNTHPHLANYTVSTAAKRRANTEPNTPTTTDPEVRNYRYLGTDISPGWMHGRESARNEMRIKAITVLKVIGRIPILTSAQMASFMTSALSSVISYKSRSTILRWEDAEAIEAARAQAMRTAGYSPGVPRTQLYEPEDMGGHAHQHVYAISAAAYIDQIDRALCGHFGEPHTGVVADAIARTCHRLGCRDVSPLEWHPDHIPHECLSEDLMIEAWVLAKLRMGMCGVRTAMKLHGSLHDDRWTINDATRLRQGPMLWETRTYGPWAGIHRCTYDKKMAESDLITWADITDPHTGDWLPWSEISANSAGRLCGANDSTAYKHLIAQLNAPSNADARARWRHHVLSTPYVTPHAPTTTPTTWAYEHVIAARRTATCFGGWEYLVKWVGYDKLTWEKKCDIETRHVQGSAFEHARGHAYLSASLYEELQRRMRVGPSIARSRAARAQAAAEGDPDATPYDLDHLYDIFTAHATNIAHIDGHYAAWSESPHRDTTHAVAKTGACMWEAEPWCTNHEGGTEIVHVTTGNKTRTETRKCADLNNDNIDPEYQITRSEPQLARARLEGYALADALADVQSNLDPDTPRPSPPMQPPTSDPTGLLPDNHSIMPGDCKPAHANEPYWDTGGGPTGITEVMNGFINNDPMARVFQRCDGLETGAGITTRTGIRITCDSDERTVLKRCGRIESWKVRHAALCLHLRHHFTRVCATDGSRKMIDGTWRVAYGIWRGVQPVSHKEDTCIASGCYGGALPSTYTIHDAELYAILIELRDTVHTMETNGTSPRCLIMSDCASVLTRVENAWRAGGADGYGRQFDQGAMLEELCMLRLMIQRAGGSVIFMWVPAHRGCSPNAYADAIAKSHLMAPVDAAIAHTVAARIESRPLLWATASHLELRDRRLHQETQRASARWAANEIKQKSKNGILAGSTDTPWPAVLTGVARGGATKDPRATPGDDPLELVETRERTNARVALTHQLRVGRVEEIEHDRQWEQYRASEGNCPGKHTWSGVIGCVTCQTGLADIAHVLTGACHGAIGTDIYLAQLHEHLTALERLIPRPTLQRHTPLNTWCPCLRLVLQARYAIYCSQHNRLIQCAHADALTRILAGVLPLSRVLAAASEKQRMTCERRIITVISKMQDTLIAYKHGRWDNMRTLRTDLETQWDCEWKQRCDARAAEQAAAKAAAQAQAQAHAAQEAAMAAHRAQLEAQEQRDHAKRQRLARVEKRNREPDPEPCQCEASTSTSTPNSATTLTSTPPPHAVHMTTIPTMPQPHGASSTAPQTYAPPPSASTHASNTAMHAPADDAVGEDVGQAVHAACAAAQFPAAAAQQVAARAQRSPSAPRTAAAPAALASPAAAAQAATPPSPRSAAAPPAAPPPIAFSAPQLLSTTDHGRASSSQTFHKNRFPQNEAGVETADTETHPSVSYSFIAYRQFQNDIVWIDELYTADCVRQQGVARWLVWQIGHRQCIELQVSTAPTEQAEIARYSYTTMGLKPLKGRERSRVVTGPDDGYAVWRTPEYNVTSGWTPLPHRDTQFHDTWSALTEVQRTALVHTMMHTHGYSEDKARRHFAGSAAAEEAMVMIIVHDLAAPPPLPPSPHPSPHGRAARRGRGVGLRRPPDGVTRPRRHRDTTSRHTTATLHAVERALRGTTDADGDSSGVT